MELDKLPPAPVPASKTDGGSPAKKGKKKRKEAAAPAMQKRFRLPKEETERIERLLQRSVDRESGKECDLNVTEDNPDGREFRKRLVDISSLNRPSRPRLGCLNSSHGEFTQRQDRFEIPCNPNFDS